MRFPMRLNYDLTKYIISNKINKIEKYPLVLMLEPTHLCNLTCSGCGRIREYADTIQDMMTLEECLQSVDECPAPVVTITGGEPFLYPHIHELIAAVLQRGKHIYLCTNGILLENALELMEPHPNFTLNIHVDGLEETHDRILERKGAFKTAIEAIKKAKEKGFRVCTNTTIFNDTDLVEIEMLFRRLEEIGVDGVLVAPGFGYEAVGEKLFLARRDIEKKFIDVYEMSKKHRFFSTPMYLRFLKGERKLDCTPWGNPTRNPQGWKAPCYLITDAHYPTFAEMMAKTEWEKYGVGKDPRCAQCMMHCGFEPTVVQEISKSWKDMLEMLFWNLT
ncbi:MAG: adenosyl-hopene transferase HpnH [Desulfuromonadaceae bacterium]|nr:adenosyl-hopene transferase HpnH [Desulfuromonadaceae bacterium]MDD2849806.1 adenosyl-hopene transferase HpnH [Desulfuromonadaceae bacterium]MDD4129338.1 adenosyl-hopene transferase HpnH [Desulfuromonadaceae bacterium]